MSLTETEVLITRLADALAALQKPAIPLSIDMWAIATIAAVLKRYPQVVREHMTCLPSFAKAIRLPTKTDRAQPLYIALEVMEWIKSHKEKH